MEEEGSERARLRIASTAADLGRLYPWLDAAAAGAVPAAMLNGMHVALEEAVANIAMHAYPIDAPGEIAIRLTRLADGVALTVEDEGPAFDPTAAAARAQPASILDAEPGGLGISLMRHYCRSIAYERADGRNRLTLHFAAPAA